jgi:hypothetical protein
MKKMSRDNRRIALFLAPVAFVLVSLACDNGSGSVAPEEDNPGVLAAMEEAIQDEYRAELIYQKVLDDFGSVRPFVNIINAEVRHSQSLASLYLSRGLPVPESRWSATDIPGYPSVIEACQAGVRAEIENAEIYAKYMDLDLPADVRWVFENNQWASLQKHLPAFQRCS